MQLGDLKKNIELQQAESIKAELKLNSALEDLEKQKSKFDADRAALESEKADLLRRAEDAEKHLKPAIEELVGLKQHISQMTTAIFGKLKTCP